MPLIKCPECAREISDKAENCIHCGYPIKKQNSVGKVIFNTSGDFLGLLGKYIIKDKKGNVIAKLRSNASFEVEISEDTTFYIRYNGSFNSYKEFFVPANDISRFSIGLSLSGFGFYVTKL